MNGLILLLYCIEILGVLGESITGPTLAGKGQYGSNNLRTTFASTTTSIAGPTSASSDMSETSRLMNTESPTTVSISHTISPSRSPEPTAPNTPSTLYGMFNKKECLPVFMVSGGLIIACAILLVSALLLAWKVSQLSRRIKALSSNSDLISNSEYWIGTAKKNKSKSDAETKETSILMADQEEGGKENKDEQMGDENKKEMANGEEASTTPVTVAENSSSSKPQEEATDSQSATAVAASSSEGTEELKDGV